MGHYTDNTEYIAASCGAEDQSSELERCRCASRIRRTGGDRPRSAIRNSVQLSADATRPNLDLRPSAPRIARDQATFRVA